MQIVTFHPHLTSRFKGEERPNTARANQTMKKDFVYLILTCFAVPLLLIASCNATGAQDEVVSSAPDEDALMTMLLSSTAFKEGEKIPVKYACDGQNISPDLSWDESPQSTETFVLIVDDPDAPGGVFTHWIIFNIPANIDRFAEGISAQEELENGVLQGRNGFGKTGYGGPCPPKESTHRYRFTIYALDERLELRAGVSLMQVMDAMQGHILAQGQLTGTYQR